MPAGKSGSSSERPLWSIPYVFKALYKWLQSISAHTIPSVILTTTLWGRCYDGHFTGEGTEGLRDTQTHDLEFTSNSRLWSSELFVNLERNERCENVICELINTETYTHITLHCIFPVPFWRGGGCLFLPFPLSHFYPFLHPHKVSPGLLKYFFIFRIYNQYLKCSRTRGFLEQNISALFFHDQNILAWDSQVI